MRFPEPLEKTIQKAIVNVLRARGYVVEVVRMGAAKIPRPGAKARFVRMGLSVGAPDLVVVAARGVWLEVKRPSGKITDAQFAWHVVARRQGAFVAVVRSPEEALVAVDAAMRDARDVGARWMR